MVAPAPTRALTSLEKLHAVPRAETTRRWQVAATLAAIWLVDTGLNLTKALHVDDTAYLEVARLIRADPWHPMAGTVHWGPTAEPVSAINQPHLFFYLLAGVMAAVGEREWAFHALEAAFSLGAIVFFYLLARRWTPAHALYLTALLALGPAFVPSQNVMVDVPILCLWLACFWALLRAFDSARPTRYDATAGVTAGLACLIKYTSLVLLPILTLAVAFRQRWRLAWVLALPLGALAAWSLFNYLDYGHVHLLTRDQGSRPSGIFVTRCLEWLICVGGVTPFSVLYLPLLARHRWGRLLLLASLVAGGANLLWGLSNHAGEGTLSSLLRAAFLTNGLLLFAATVAVVCRGFRDSRRNGDAAGAYAWMLLGAWLLGVSAFIVLLAPFVAVRHALLIVPVFLLVPGRELLRRLSGPWLAAAGVATAGLGLALGVSDWVFADVYRQEAGRIMAKLGPDRTVWFVGHWGWQWYAANAGMKQYDYRFSRLREGDYVVVPLYADQQPLSKLDEKRLREVEVVTVPSGQATRVRTQSVHPGFGFYHNDLVNLPWCVSGGPLEEFRIHVVGPEAEEDGRTEAP
jgi:4-amino-4-deoxy-L-arabinose transferase-like glycosyltransferase